ncbi:hypothetical protein V6N13_042349 [Hibiscus sabdariffa]|uniref:Protein BIG GRAIN 1-like E n=2 Tax=Hibiscus sabdariffa TaxID=183260 RepID=A0ABR2A6J7_9ROSI
MSKKSFNDRNGSGELDVFEAAKYFSGHNEAANVYNRETSTGQKVTRDEIRQPLKGGRISLDLPTRRNPLLQQSHSSEKQVKEKKHKQPSSPGGKLASFLNSLFNQTGSKKKKDSKSSAEQSMKGEEESHGGGRRKRRMSIGHFLSSNIVDTMSFYSSSSSGFRTPPPFAAATRKKSYKGSDPLNETRNGKSQLVDGILEKHKILDTHHRYQAEEKDLMKFHEVDDGADSDSSSDLFELQSCDLGVYSSGLPGFKRGAPVSNGVL